MKTITLALTALPFLGSFAFAQDFNEFPPNSPDFKPAFEGQTRAPVIADAIEIKKEVLVDGLNHPWGMAELPDGSWLITERAGALRLLGADGVLSEPISGLPEVVAERQAGLLDVAVRDDFAQTRRIWWTFSEPREEGKNATAIGTGILSADGKSVEEATVIFQQQPAWDSTLHYGSRIVFAPDDTMFVTLGERSNPESRVLAQDVGTHLGKVVRLTLEGKAAEGNPVIEGGLPEIWSYGHRNPQSATIGPDGKLWVIEHGPRGGDELNQPKPGLNYGWPVITYGQEYSGDAIGDPPLTQMEGMEQPAYYWDPVIAPSGLTFYEGDLFADWKGSLLVGGLASQSLVRLTLDGEKVTGEARYLIGDNRIRDVAEAADGSIMILTDEDNGALIRLTPQ